MARQDTQNTEKQNRQKTIELLKPHTHAGRDYPAGAKLTMDADSAEWLIAIGSAAEAP